MSCHFALCNWIVAQVILIHLSNLTGLKGEYNKRTMFLLVSDLGCIVWGASAANAKGAAKAIFFVVAMCYSANTFYQAARVYIESFHMVPKGRCRQLVMVLAWMFFASWGLFPLAFVAGAPLAFIGHVLVIASVHSLSDPCIAIQRSHTAARPACDTGPVCMAAASA
jgi:ABC-type amino acid transport system permease subunit